MTQLSFFQEKQEQPTNSELQVMDIRTEKQANNTVSYDVGEKIGAAKKDFFADQRLHFLNRPDIETLQMIEKEDVTTAAELVRKDTFFSWFSLEDCKSKGIDPKVAKGIQLLIRRIDNAPADSKEERERFTKACLYISNLFQCILSYNDFKEMERLVRGHLAKEGGSITHHKKIIWAIEEGLQYETNEDFITELKKQIEEKKKSIREIEQANALGLSSLGKSFSNYFLNTQSRRGTYRSMNEISSWDDLLQERQPARTGKRGKAWERVLPTNPSRHGGQLVTVKSPEELVALYNFKGIEFGHYVEDKVGFEHLIHSAEAFSDLVDILDISPESVSFYGDLSLAFGSRGSGSALAHYEPSRKVINLTKKRGSLGVLSHEYFHALDLYLFSYSHGFQNGIPGFISKGEFGDKLPIEVKRAVTRLIRVMTKGNATATFEIPVNAGKYRMNSTFIERYNRFNGDLKVIMDEILETFDERAERQLKGYESIGYVESLQKAKEKVERSRRQTLRSNAIALAQYHEEVTGVKVTSIPYTSDRTQFFQTGVELDKYKVGKYWSAPHELAARAFEAYVHNELNKRGWRSDYLVSGIDDVIYPVGEERKAIKKAMHDLILAIRPILK